MRADAEPLGQCSALLRYLALEQENDLPLLPSPFDEFGNNELMMEISA